MSDLDQQIQTTMNTLIALQAAKIVQLDRERKRLEAEVQRLKNPNAKGSKAVQA